MNKKKPSRKVSLFLCLALMLGLIASMGVVAYAAGEEAGTYNGTSTAANGTEYTHAMTLDGAGNYTCVTTFAMRGDTYVQTETGTYTVSGSTITFPAGGTASVPAAGMEDVAVETENTGTLDGDTLVVNRHASIFSMTMGGAKVDLTLTREASDEPATDEPATDEPAADEPATDEPAADDPATDEPAATTKEDNLPSGTYDLSVELAAMNVTMQGDVKVDRSANTVEIWRTTNSGEYSKRSEGTLSFDSATGVYTINYSEPAGMTTTFTYNAATQSLDFTSPAYFGRVALNVTDENDNFIPYSAPLKAENVQPTEPKTDEKEEPKPTETKTDTKTDSKTDTKTDSKTQQTAKPQTTAKAAATAVPKTGDEADAAVLIAAFVASALGALMVLKSRRA